MLGRNIHPQPIAEGKAKSGYTVSLVLPLASQETHQQNKEKEKTK